MFYLGMQQVSDYLFIYLKWQKYIDDVLSPSHGGFASWFCYTYFIGEKSNLKDWITCVKSWSVSDGSGLWIQVLWLFPFCLYCIPLDLIKMVFPYSGLYGEGLVCQLSSYYIFKNSFPCIALSSCWATGDTFWKLRWYKWRSSHTSGHWGISARHEAP